MAKKLISIDLKAQMGCLKKPDINEGIYLTFNMLHKPALLGILGAILGLKGYQRKGEFPEYYRILKDLQIGIEPLNSEKGNFTKTVIKYNNAVGYASQEAGGILNVTEQTLMRPEFRCYLLLDENNLLHSQLISLLENEQANYLPYLGKNEYSVWWESFQIYQYNEFRYDRNYQIKTIFYKTPNVVIRPNIVEDLLGGYDSDVITLPFITFERLPIGFNEILKQYAYGEFVFTNSQLTSDTQLDNLYEINGNEALIQLF